MNPIFSVIRTLSSSFPKEDNAFSVPAEEKLHQVYLTFASSNFFWDILDEIIKIAALSGLETPSFGPQSTSITNLPQFKQFSNTQENIGNPALHIPASVIPASGATTHPVQPNSGKWQK